MPVGTTVGATWPVGELAPVALRELLVLADLLVLVDLLADALVADLVVLLLGVEPTRLAEHCEG